jgi:hypothetical protein
MIKLNVLANPIDINDFSLMVNYIASTSDLIVKYSFSSNHQIADVSRGGRDCMQGKGNRNHVGLGRYGQGRNEINEEEVMDEIEVEVEDTYHGVKRTLDRVKINPFHVDIQEKNGKTSHAVKGTEYIERETA